MENVTFSEVKQRCIILKQNLSCDTFKKFFSLWFVRYNQFAATATASGGSFDNKGEIRGKWPTTHGQQSQLLKM